ncbi:hypothetical protein OUZ56_011835 [Daphnia magna]|uniref:Uncharacterized protein n=1 Tax=Daphnia magna TaxID=35525 RepID=A0ABQ9Z197_9CRUS|nr:hypothetical protein OUZ56_011835 [Daphnia magna]
MACANNTDCQPSNSQDHVTIYVERESDEAGKNGTSSFGKNSLSKNKESIPHVVYVPPKYYQKESVSSKSIKYKCLMGCRNKFVTVFNQTLFNVRRHVELFHKPLLDEFNASFGAGRYSANVNGKELLSAKTDKHCVNTNIPSRTTPIVTQCQFDD